MLPWVPRTRCEEHGLQRVAIVDFDVHHGNGTEDIFKDDERVLFCSTFQHPFFPFTPMLENSPNRVSVPLEATAKSAEFRSAVTEQWLPALASFEPEMVFVSAGFDAHVDDDMSYVSLVDADFKWVTEQIVTGRRVTRLQVGSCPRWKAAMNSIALRAAWRCTFACLWGSSNAAEPSRLQTRCRTALSGRR